MSFTKGRLYDYIPKYVEIKTQLERTQSVGNILSLELKFGPIIFL